MKKLILASLLLVLASFLMPAAEASVCYNCPGPDGSPYCYRLGWSEPFSLGFTNCRQGPATTNSGYVIGQYCQVFGHQCTWWDVIF